MVLKEELHIQRRVTSGAVPYGRRSLSYTLGRLPAVPEVVEGPVVLVVVVRDRPRRKYQAAAAAMARTRMSHSQLAPPSVAAGAAGAAGVVCARASFTATNVAAVEIWSVLSMMVVPLPS